MSIENAVAVKPCDDSAGDDMTQIINPLWIGTATSYSALWPRCQPPKAARKASVIIHAKSPDIVAIMRSFSREGLPRIIRSLRDAR